MEKDNKELRKEDIKQIILKIQRRYNYPQDIVDIIESDLSSGVSEEALSLYVGKKLDKRKIVVMSQCLRNGYDSDVINTVCNESFSSHLMETAYKAYQEFKDLDKVKQILKSNENVPDRVKATINKYEEMLPKKPVPKENVRPSESRMFISDEEKSFINSLMEKLSEMQSKLDEQVKNSEGFYKKLADTLEKVSAPIKENAILPVETVPERETKDLDEEVRQQLIDELAKREQEIASKQDELAEALSQVKSLNRSNEKKDNEVRLLRETVADLQKQVRRKGDALEEANATINKLKEAASKGVTEKPAADSDKANSDTEVKKVQEMDNVIPVYYTMPVVGYSEVPAAGITIDRTEKKSSGLLGLFSKLCFKKKSRVDIIKLVSAGKLSTEQLVMIKVAIEKQLTEGQLVELINNNLEPSKMKEIIEIAVLENSLPD